MRDSRIPDAGDNEPARRAYEEFLRRRERGDPRSLEEYCRDECPDIRDGVLYLDSIASDATNDAASERVADRVTFRDALEQLQASIDGPGLQSGDLLGPYQIEERIGEGGFGAVFRARQREPVSRTVAIKILKPEAYRRETISRFIHEGQVLAGLDHPAIAKIHDAGVVGERCPYFVLEYIPGASLTEYCDSRRLDLEGRLELLAEVCDAVHHAHLRGLLHRDLKPSNILVSEAEGETRRPRVIDFGLAKEVGGPGSDSAPATMEGVLLGTPEYMSPEQALGRTADVDVRSDVYSLGVILYELLTGTLPIRFDASQRRDLSSVQRRIREEDPPSLDRRVSELDRELRLEVAIQRSVDPVRLTHRLRGELSWIVLRALEKERERRYQSAAELGEDLRRFLRNEPVAAGPPGALYRLRKFARRNPGVVIVVAAFVIMALATGIGRWAMRERRLAQSRSEIQVALAEDRVEDATAALSYLREEFPQREETRAAGRRVVASIVEQARRTWVQFRSELETADQLHNAWRQERARVEDAAPAWHRGKELELWNRYQELVPTLNATATSALALLDRADNAARAEADLRAVIRENRARYNLELARALDKEHPHLDFRRFFRERVREQGPTGALAEIEGSRAFEFLTEPAPADVHCFRYREHQGRLLPIGYRPGRGWVGQRALVVARGDAPFEPGDIVLGLNGHAVRSESELAHALEASWSESRSSFEVTVQRGNREVELAWKAGPPEGQRVRNFWLQLGVSFQGYPLLFTDDNRLGRASAERALSIDLEPGSYLLVFRAGGHVDTRYPIVVPGPRGEGSERREPIRVRLLREDELPPDFVHVPAGELALGGDRAAFEPLWGEPRFIDGFCIGRHEITNGQWNEFLLAAREEMGLGPEGKILPFSGEVKEQLDRLGLKHGPFFLVPRNDGAFLRWEWSEEEDSWVPKDPPPAFLSQPVRTIRQLAAMEYAAWRTRQARARGEPWRYRLPDEFQWQRAAQGADRRRFVWGDYLIWSSCHSLKGSATRSPADGLGTYAAYPHDESPFGVIAMNGSVSEHTRSRKFDDERYVVYRGGSFENNDLLYFTLTSRNSVYPWRVWPHNGLRLVAELVDGEAGGK